MYFIFSIPCWAGKCSLHATFLSGFLVGPGRDHFVLLYFLDSLWDAWLVQVYGPWSIGLWSMEDGGWRMEDRSMVHGGWMMEDGG